MMSFKSTDLPARLDQHSSCWTLFLSLSLHHYPPALLWHHSFHLFFCFSLQQLCIIFFCLAWPYSTPSFHVPLHRRLFGVSRLCMSLEQTSWLCFCLLCSYFDSVLLWLVLLWSAIAAWLPFCYTETLHSSDAFRIISFSAFPVTSALSAQKLF